MGETTGTQDVHVVLTALSPNEQKLEPVLERARKAYQELQGIKAIWRQDCYASATRKEPFGFIDGISHLAIEGSGIPGINPRDPSFKAGEFVLVYQTRLVRFLLCRNQIHSAETEPTLCSVNSINEWQLSGNT